MKNIEKLAEFKKNPQQPNNDEMDIICMNDVEMKPIDWLWPERIAHGKLTVMAGNPGLGKSQITAWMAATISMGNKWPDTDTTAVKGNVIIISAEDDPADTIKPRLLAAGANIKSCHVLQAIRTKDPKGKPGRRTFDLTKDIEKLGEMIDKMGEVRLVIIDPISAYMGDTDSHNNTDTRGMLAPLSDMAALYNVAIVLVTHLNKSTQQDAIGRVIGSIGLIAAARAGYIIVKDEQKPENRYFVPVKNNIGNDKDGFSFHIDGVMLSNNIETSKIVWHAGVVQAHKILYPEQAHKPTATTGAADFLQEILSQNPMQMKDILEDAEGAGYSKSALQRASRRIGVKHKKDGMTGGWIWSLPSSDRGGEDGDT